MTEVPVENEHYRVDLTNPLVSASDRVSLDQETLDNIAASAYARDKCLFGVCLHCKLPLKAVVRHVRVIHKGADRRHPGRCLPEGLGKAVPPDCLSARCYSSRSLSQSPFGELTFTSTFSILLCSTLLHSHNLPCWMIEHFQRREKLRSRNRTARNGRSSWMRKLWRILLRQAMRVANASAAFVCCVSSRLGVPLPTFSYTSGTLIDEVNRLLIPAQIRCHLQFSFATSVEFGLTNYASYLCMFHFMWSILGC